MGLLLILRMQLVSSAVDLGLVSFKVVHTADSLYKCGNTILLISVKYEIDSLPRASCKCWFWCCRLPFGSSLFTAPAIFPSVLAFLGIVLLSTVEKDTSHLLLGPLPALVIAKFHFSTIEAVE